MEDPPFPTHPPDHRSKRRRFAGGSSSSNNNTSASSFIDADVIEIPPPVTWKPKRLKATPKVQHEVINIDDEDIDDIIIIGETLAPNNKGKKPMFNYHAPKKSSSTEATIICDDFNGIDLTSNDNYFPMLQEHFDDFDITTGIEANIPFWLDPSATQSKNPPPVFVQPPIIPSYPQQPVFFGAHNDQHYKPINNHSYHKAKRGKHHGSKSDHNDPMLSSSGIPMNPPQWGPFPLNPFQEPNVNPNPAQAYLDNIYTQLGSFAPGFGVGNRNNSIILDDDIAAQISPPSTSGQEGDIENPILKKLEAFKKFDTLEDHSDHLYRQTKELLKQSKSWGKTIAEEWRMLENDLPDTIYVRVFESRMDLLRAVIIGAEGTPYHDGLFFFDVNFTGAYPKSPPHVKYHAHGLRINPNLYNCGKVCLSLLGTWAGNGEENWRPGKSNMLQVLVSIQGLILNAEPYFNEPGYASSVNSPHGKAQSKNYSENTLLLSLKTMLYTMRNPPKNFEDLVFGHFYKKAGDILTACTAYLHGVKVGSFEKGKTQTPPGKSKCSQMLKDSLPGYIKNLVEAFTKIGVKDCEKYLVSPENAARVQHPGESSKKPRKSRKR